MNAPIQTRAYDDFPQAVAIARALIASAERDVNCKLTRSQCNDLLMDNTTWSRSAIVAVMDAI